MAEETENPQEPDGDEATGIEKITDATEGAAEASSPAEATDAGMPDGDGGRATKPEGEDAGASRKTSDDEDAEPGILTGMADRQVAVEGVGLVKDYGSGDTAVHALRSVNVMFEKGKFTAIMGPSGSGKSTLMHVLSGLDTPTQGRVLFDGKDITKLSDKELTLLRRDNIGFVFQSFNLLPMFTAEQNIIMPLTLAGKKPDKAWLKTITDKLGIGDRLTHRPAELSGGQQQRVAIARALISHPKVVFADEPTGALDTVASAEVMHILRTAVDDMGQTVIMVTHDASAAAYADRALVMADGAIVDDVNSPTEEQMVQLVSAHRRSLQTSAS